MGEYYPLLQLLPIYPLQLFRDWTDGPRAGVHTSLQSRYRLRVASLVDALADRGSKGLVIGVRIYVAKN